MEGIGGGFFFKGMCVAEVAQRWRVPEFVGLLVVLTVIMQAKTFNLEYQQFIPPNNEKGVNGYPVRLGSEWCTASDLSSCQTRPESGCCQGMEAGQDPGEVCTTFLLWLVYFALPLTFVLVRQGLTACRLYKGSVGTVQDALLGLALSLGFCVALTDVIKMAVGRPRPNYFALRALVQYGGSKMSDFEGKSIRSFPSGHSSESMAGGLYVTLLCWADLSQPSSNGVRQPWRRCLLAYLSMLPTLLSFWVGTTRVRDYWHFQDDVVAGWVIGAVSAVVAVRWAIFSETDFSTGTGERGRSSHDNGSLHCQALLSPLEDDSGAARGNIRGKALMMVGSVGSSSSNSNSSRRRRSDVEGSDDLERGPGCLSGTAAGAAVSSADRFWSVL